MKKTNSKPSKALSNDIEQLHKALTEIARIYQFRDKDRDCRQDLSISQCYALYALKEKGNLSLNDLAAELNLEKSSASRMIKGLMAKGYVKRSEDAADSRKISLEITAKGKSLYKKIDDDLIHEEREVFSGFGSKERKAAIEILGRLASVVSSRVACK